MTPLPRPLSPADRLPPLAGRVQADAPIAPHTWFRVGGPAEALVRPADADDLAGFLRALPADVPLTVLGAASNVIVRDGGVRGVVVRLGRGFADVRVEPDGVVAGAAALDATVAEHAAAAGLAGLEFLSGIPGSVGGAVGCGVASRRRRSGTRRRSGGAVGDPSCGRWLVRRRWPSPTTRRAARGRGRRRTPRSTRGRGTPGNPASPGAERRSTPIRRR